MKTCSHTNQIRDVKPVTPNGCEECLAIGDEWVSLRKCLICGHVGCCDSSKNRHARKHFEATGHPIMESYKTRASFRWCYIDKIYIGKRPNPFLVVLYFIKHRLLRSLRRLPSQQG
ncbi:UBP-type zinc finger domain-containing protein [Candidatus Saccharibacteria bacterium]|nr:UBP-type zinc finger domain-containing protein [Candidatus Saccharibacteria bacterium]